MDGGTDGGTDGNRCGDKRKQAPERDLSGAWTDDGTGAGAAAELAAVAGAAGVFLHPNIVIQFRCEVGRNGATPGGTVGNKLIPVETELLGGGAGNVSG